MTEDEKLAQLYPPFAEDIRRLLAALRSAGLPFYLFMGLRTFAEQDALYAQGRTATGNIVTNAKGGDSWHNYGLAVDLVLDGQTEKPGIQWSWDTKADHNKNARDDWHDMAIMAIQCGLEPGATWKTFPDLPHIQNRYGLTPAEAKELWRQGGIAKVWEACK